MILAPASAMRSISLFTSSHAEKPRSPSIASLSKPWTWANSLSEAEKARLGSPKWSANFLKPTHPNPLTRASASQGACSFSSKEGKEYPSFEAITGSAISIYPVPQNAPDVSAGMNPVPTPLRENYTLSIQPGWNGVNVLNFPEGQRHKATEVSPWYGVYRFS